MKLILIKALWGLEGEPIQSAFKKIKNAGYAGVEEGPPDPAKKGEFKQMLLDFDLQYVGMIYTKHPDHAESFEAQLENLAGFGPPNYMPTMPHTQEPLADLFEICHWMADRFNRRFHERTSDS